MYQVERRIYGRPMLSFERTVRRVRVDVRGMNEGDEGERNDNRGGRDQSVVVEIRCKREYWWRDTTNERG